MRGTIVIMLFAFVAQADNDLLDNADNLVDWLVNRALRVRTLNHIDFDSTAVAKPVQMSEGLPHSQLRSGSLLAAARSTDLAPCSSFRSLGSQVLLPRSLSPPRLESFAPCRQHTITHAFFPPPPPSRKGELGSSNRKPKPAQPKPKPMPAQEFSDFNQSSQGFNPMAGFMNPASMQQGMMGDPSLMPQDMEGDMKKFKGMLKNPLVKGMIKKVMKDPQMLQSMLMKNPGYKEMTEQNPMMATMMSDPKILQMAFSAMVGPPENLHEALRVDTVPPILEEDDVTVVPMPADGSSLFHALSHELTHLGFEGQTPAVVRKNIADFFLNNPNFFMKVVDEGIEGEHIDLVTRWTRRGGVSPEQIIQRGQSLAAGSPAQGDWLELFVFTLIYEMNLCVYRKRRWLRRRLPFGEGQLKRYQELEAQLWEFNESQGTALIMWSGGKDPGGVRHFDALIQNISAPAENDMFANMFQSMMGR